MSCPHLSEFKSKLGPYSFRVLTHCLRVKPLGRTSIHHDPGELPRCLACGPHSNSFPSGLYACLSCASVSCYAHASSDPSPCHVIGVDVDRAELFCFICLDQIYDGDFDTTVILAQKALASSSLLQNPFPPQNNNSHMNKRRRIDYVPWSADPLEKSLTQNNSSPLNYNVGNNTLNYNVAGNNIDSNNGNGNDDVVESSLPWGLRGLNNLGNTCFMNSVLQALLHTPPLRNYFLSDRHNRYFCKQKKKISSTLGSGGGRNLSSGRCGRGGRESDNKVNHLCLACDLDEIFSAVFKGDRTPFSPSSFLYSWWQHAANLASYEQQDAHEFFISMLTGIHEKVERDLRKPQSQGNGDCCIAHRVFSGILRSDVMCMACGFTSTTYDPCVDISLDLEPNKGNSLRTASTGTNSSYSGVANGTHPSHYRGASTLMGCLDRFTRPERLGSDQKFFCQKCQVKQESLKQMSIRKLPLVSCFHIKRFEHSSIRKMSRKVDHYLEFPFSLDMAPYLSSSILRSRYGNRMFTFDGDDPESPTEPSSEFELFAVVTHSGRLDAGHYVTYLRLSNHWYKCDDAWITEVSETIVRAAQGYMMFYVQKMLHYKAGEKQATP